jgi:hypothetical protein
MMVTEKITFDIRLMRRLQRERLTEEEKMAKQRQQDSLRQLEQRQRFERIMDSINTIDPGPQPIAKDFSKYTFQMVEKMVTDIAKEDYFASAWQIDKVNWIMRYTSGGRECFRTFNMAKRTYGPKIRVVMDKQGDYHIASNLRNIYRQERGYLTYIENGIVKGRYPHQGLLLIDLGKDDFEDYESIEDYYYDNEEDLREYYR